MLGSARQCSAVRGNAHGANNASRSKRRCSVQKATDVFPDHTVCFQARDKVLPKQKK